MARNKEKTRNKILQASAECFTRDGYTDTSIQQIAELAQISPATIYQHFSGKQELFNILRKMGSLTEQTLTRREEIIQAALDIFSQNGYDGTSMEMIASQVGLTKGALYGYFENKDDILQSVISSASNFPTLHSSADTSDVDPHPHEQLLYSFAVMYLSIFHDPKRISFLKILLEQSSHNATIANLFYKTAIEPGIQYLTNVIAGIRNRNDNENIEIARAFMGMLINWVLQHKIFLFSNQLPEESEETMAHRAVELVLNGLQRSKI